MPSALPWCKAVWSAPSPGMLPRWKFILWLATKFKLRTLDIAPYLNQVVSCTLCKSLNESTVHLFFDCNFSWNVWTFVLEKTGLHLNIRSATRLLSWMGSRGRYAGFMGKKRCLALAATVHLIWQARNLSLFDGINTPWMDTASKAEFYILRAFHLGHLF